jgi:hypothetical protein
MIAQNTAAAISAELVAELTARCPDYALGHAYELLASGKAKTVKHAISASLIGENRRNGALCSMRSFSDVSETGNVETDGQAVDLELTAEHAATIRKELDEALDDNDRFRLEMIADGQMIADNERTNRRRVAELEQRCATALGVVIARRKRKVEA